MNPVRLQELMHGVSEDVVVSSKDLAEFLKNPCVAAFRRDVLAHVESLWSSILRAKSWDEFSALRGAYRAMVTLLELPDNITAESPETPATPAEDVQRDLGKMKEILDGNP